MNFDTIRAVEWTDHGLKLLDQRLLPHHHEVITYTDAADVALAIKEMVVRGAPAIGITAAYAVVLAARRRYAKSPRTWKNDTFQDIERLAHARPTAVNLHWALARMQRLIEGLWDSPEVALLAEARRIHAEDIAANRRMGEFGAKLIAEGKSVITHCNTGSLATGGYGTALGVIRSAWSQGRIVSVYADETRPWLQGARLTAWELVQDRIPVTLMAEGAAAHRMKQGDVSWVIVGADRITANGDAANKIGTYQLAIAARFHGVKFMVVAPSSTVDMAIDNGSDIPIEMRAPEEVLSLNGHRVAAMGADAWNPSFDVTPASLIDAIVTERGAILQPNAERMRKLMG
ncbi:MAG: S-methyl-5-thioribose-1-phosphate isomerase [Gammaproteobacteria bacterium]|nr:S-methyl-5-thioribose-1-phosphate isomerase [Gammaproteobacteria bacterium]